MVAQIAFEVLARIAHAGSADPLGRGGVFESRRLVENLFFEDRFEHYGARIVASALFDTLGIGRVG